MGHATDGPGGWKEPRALAATDHTAQRAHQGRGRPTIRRRVSGECAGGRLGAGSVIPHARAIRALVVAMIEATFRTPAVSVTGGRDRAPAAGGATPARAVRVAPIAGDTDREDAMTATAGFLAERNVHGVGAAVRSDWTYSPNRGTTDRTASARRSPRQSPRVRRISPGPHPQPAQPTRSRVHATAKRPWTLPDPWTRGRAHRSLQNRADAVSHKRPPPSSFS